MKAIGMASLYSGRQNPERELTHEEYMKVRELATQATEALKHPVGASLGAYFVSNQENWYVISHPHGWLGIWSPADMNIKYYKDTVGLMSYLHLILGPMVQKHVEDGQEEMQKAMEQDLGRATIFKIPGS